MQTARQYSPTGASLRPGVLRGPGWRSWPSLRGSQRAAYLQVRTVKGPRSLPLWGQHWTRLPQKTREVLPQRGHGLRPHHGGLAAEGSGRGPRCITAPVVVPRKRPVCRRKAAGSGGPCPLGAAMDSSAFFLADARSTATTGAWPSPTITASPCQGSDKAMMAPSGGP
jgi:hypothetical protein